MIVLCLFLGLAVAADRVAAIVVTRSLERSITQQVPGVTGFDIELRGFPFLTQLAAGSLNEVELSLRSGTFAGVALRDVRVTATGVSTTSPWRAAHVEADGVVVFDAVAAEIAALLGSTGVLESVLGADLQGLRAPLRLPGDIQLISVRAEPAGVRVVLQGRNVTLGELVR